MDGEGYRRVKERGKEGVEGEVRDQERTTEGKRMKEREQEKKGRWERKRRGMEGKDKVVGGGKGGGRQMFTPVLS